MDRSPAPPIGALQRRISKRNRLLPTHRGSAQKSIPRNFEGGNKKRRNRAEKMLATIRERLFLCDFYFKMKNQLKRKKRVWLVLTPLFAEICSTEKGGRSPLCYAHSCCVIPGAYCPVNFGLCFSRNALTAASKSLVREHSAMKAPSFFIYVSISPKKNSVISFFWRVKA